MNPIRYLALCVTACALGACGGSGGGSSSGSSGSSGGGVYADRVVASAIINSQAAAEEDWPYFFADNAALGVPGGTLDVVSLGYDPSATDTLGGAIVLGFGDSNGRRCIVNSAGDDLVVFENPFRTTDVDDNAGTNNELVIVEVSGNSTDWYGFAPAVTDAGLPLIDTARYARFAGVIPRNEGGDRFDFADLVGIPVPLADFQACYVRLTDAGTLYEDYGNTQSDLWDSGADIDAVQALHSIAVPSQSP